MVYIVDDDPDMRDSLRFLLKTVGLRTATFSSAAEFIGGYTCAARRVWCSTSACRERADSIFSSN